MRISKPSSKQLHQQILKEGEVLVTTCGSSDTQPLTGHSRHEVVGVASAPSVVEQTAAPGAGVEEPARKASPALPDHPRQLAGPVQIGSGGGSRLASLLALQLGCEPVGVALAASVHEVFASPGLRVVEIGRNVGLTGPCSLGQIALIVTG